MHRRRSLTRSDDVTPIPTARARAIALPRFGTRVFQRMNTANLGGTLTLPGTSITLNRIGYGAMQLTGPHVFGPPADHDAAIAVLREVVQLGINHIDTSDFYGPHVTNHLIKEAL